MRKLITLCLLSIIPMFFYRCSSHSNKINADGTIDSTGYFANTSMISVSGKLLAGKRTGQWTYFYYNPNTKAYFPRAILTYKAGLLDGKISACDSFGFPCLEATYKNGLKDGVEHLSTYNAHDSLVRYIESNFVNGIKDGKETEYYPYLTDKNARLLAKSITYYAHGHITLKFEYYPTGSRKGTIPYDSSCNCISGEGKQFYETGEIKCDVPYSKGLIQGVVKGYYKDGKVESETPYMNDTVDGLQKFYYESGRLKSCWHWHKGSFNMKDIMLYNEDGSLTTFEEENRKKDSALNASVIQLKQLTKQSEPPKHYMTDGQKCFHCGLGTYVSGFCNMCGAASPERVAESRQNAPNCSTCNGTGFINAMNGNKVICPECHGTGKETY